MHDRGPIMLWPNIKMVKEPGIKTNDILHLLSHHLINIGDFADQNKFHRKPIRIKTRFSSQELSGVFSHGQLHGIVPDSFTRHTTIHPIFRRLSNQTAELDQERMLVCRTPTTIFAGFDPHRLALFECSRTKAECLFSRVAFTPEHRQHFGTVAPFSHVRAPA